MSLTSFTNTTISTNKKKKEKINYVDKLIKSDKFKTYTGSEKRNHLQNAVRKTWRENNYEGFFLLSMGVGKSKIIADAIKDYKKYKNKEDKKDIDILILVNSSTLRDTGLPTELIKWKTPGAKSVKIETYQWVNRNKEIFKSQIGLLICDEVDFAISKEYGKMFDKLNCAAKLFLTGTLSDDKREVIKTYKHFPEILYEYPIKQAQEDNVINKARIFLHEVPLYTKKNVLVKTKKKQWYTSENNNYIYTQDKINSFRVLEQIYKRQGTLSEAKKYASLKRWFESSPKNSYNRVAQLTNNQSLIDYAIKLKNLLQADNEKNKVIFFATRTDVIDKLTPNGYYGDVNDDLIESFNKGEIIDIGVVKKANRGVSFVGLNNCIAVGYDSSQTKQNQGVLGRMTRLDREEIAYIHILVSTYIDDATKESDYCHSFKWIQNLIEENLENVITINKLEDTLKYIYEDN